MEHLIDDNDRLKPCPFCGSEAEIIKIDGEIDAIDTGALCVQCTACGASSTLIYQLMDDATHLLMELWNKRRSATRIVDVDALRNDLLAVMRYESRRMGAVSAAILERAIARLDGE